MTGNSNDFATIKYSSAGVPLWTNYYNGPANDDDVALAIIADGSGNVYVTGYSTGNGSSYDYATIAYSGAGVPLWTNRLNGSGNGIDIPRSIGVDGSGNVYVTGGVSVESNATFVTVAYSSAGKMLWTNHHAGIGYALAVDGGGNVYVAGYSFDGGGGNDYVTIKYGPTVALQIEQAGSEMVLSWANAAFGLQSAPFISATFTNVPGATSPYTNPITGSQQFFRLKAN